MVRPPDEMYRSSYHSPKCFISRELALDKQMTLMIKMSSGPDGYILESQEKGLQRERKQMYCTLAKSSNYTNLSGVASCEEDIKKGTLASRCSSLTSNMCSPVENQETSRRGSWNSLQDPNDKLDGISIGSFLETLADDMDEYGQTTIDPLSPTPSKQNGPFTTTEKEIYTNEKHCRRTKMAFERNKGTVADCNVENKFSHDKQCKDGGKLKIQKNGKLDYDGCKNKMHIEYDAHWHWVRSQGDVTFL
ncbi:leucine rich adaptor protein 1-like [Rhinoraja longicauda]